jgi:hypothetical protein
MTKRLLVFVLAALLLPVSAAAADDHLLMLEQLGINALRPGADGYNPKAPNAVNYDEARAGNPVLPEPLRLDNGAAVTTQAQWWQQRRPEIVAAFDSEVYGRVPPKLPAVQWQLTGAEEQSFGAHKAVSTRLIGRVDNSSFPAVKVEIALTVTLPKGASKPVPVIIALGWTGKGANQPVPEGQGPDWREQILAKGWGYAEYVPVSVQADDGAGLRAGIIGLANKGSPRQPDDWGALRAWAWGVSRVIDYLHTDRRVDAKRIGVFGHSRYGKAALVAMAYEPRLAIGYISSSGAGGAKLLRRDFGERLENLAGNGEYHWMAGNFLKYAGPKTVADLPVDAHELIALCAPRPLFIGAGADGDNWVDQRSMFLAEVAAGPVYRLLGKKDLGTAVYPPPETAMVSGELGFRRHSFGHTPQPNWASFLAFAQKYWQGL